MSDLYWLTDEQMDRLRPYFPKSHGKPRVDDRRVLSGIVFVNRNGLRWRDAPREYDPHKTLYKRRKRWGDMGVFCPSKARFQSQSPAARVASGAQSIVEQVSHLKAVKKVSGIDEPRQRAPGIGGACVYYGPTLDAQFRRVEVVTEIAAAAAHLG